MDAVARTVEGGMMDWLKDILIFLIGSMCGYLVRRSVELEFHIECTDDGDDR